MRRWAVVITLLFTSLAVSGSASAQETPYGSATLEETIQWLLSKFNGERRLSFGAYYTEKRNIYFDVKENRTVNAPATSWTSIRYELYSSDPCTLRLVENTKYEFDRKRYFLSKSGFNFGLSAIGATRMYEVVLMRLDANKITVNKKEEKLWVVNLPALNSLNSLYLHEVDDENYLGRGNRAGEVNKHVTSVPIIINDQEMAERVARAFKHAITLCSAYTYESRELDSTAKQTLTQTATRLRSILNSEGGISDTLSEAGQCGLKLKNNFSHTRFLTTFLPLYQLDIPVYLARSSDPPPNQKWWVRVLSEVSGIYEYGYSTGGGSRDTFDSPISRYVGEASIEFKSEGQAREAADLIATAIRTCQLINPVLKKTGVPTKEVEKHPFNYEENRTSSNSKLDLLAKILLDNKVMYELTQVEGGAVPTKEVEKHWFNYKEVKTGVCSLEWKETHLNKDLFYMEGKLEKERDETESEIYTVDLTTLDPFSVQLHMITGGTGGINDINKSPIKISTEVWEVVLNTYNDEGKIKNKADHGEFLLSSVSVKFHKQDIAKRVAETFREAIKLCGGKAEPF